MPLSAWTNAAAFVAARLVAAALNLISLLLAARWLAPADFGQLAVVLVVVAIANTATTFGTDDVVVREVARHDFGSMVPALRLQVLLSSGVAVAAFGLAASGLAVWWLPAGLLGLFPLAVTSTANAAMRGAERVDGVLAASTAA
ncbi:MAG: oligosaccharide flippase family protein, partial [Actinomycetota bacterium]|nr:oligosaccharide flippase family protein [Actinomycetota bacterium]